MLLELLEKPVLAMEREARFNLKSFLNKCGNHRGPPISVRCVEVNKGDDEHPKIRSRLVAREIRMAGEDEIFAPTPPLESLRMFVCLTRSLTFPTSRGHCPTRSF